MNIEIMSRERAIKHCYNRHTRPTIIISISDPNGIYHSAPVVHERTNIKAILRLCFSDADGPGCDVYGKKVDISGLMSDEDAEKVVRFVLRHSDSDLIIHCDAGISRSAGVGAAIMKAINGDDSPVFDSGRYRPNMWCYRKTLEAFQKSLQERGLL